MRDVRDALRSLRAAPGSTVVALIVFAFGIGASTLIFSMVDAVVLRALPFDEPDRIVSVGSLYNGHPGLDTAATFLEWRERQTAFEALTAIDDGALIVNADTQAEEVRLERVTAEFFSVLRVRPRIGEPFTADNEVDGRDRVAIISDGLWRSRFGADPNIVGKTMKSNIGIPARRRRRGARRSRKCRGWIRCRVACRPHADSGGLTYNPQHSQTP